MPSASFLARLGLAPARAPRLGMYDWATSAVQTTIIGGRLPDLLRARSPGPSLPESGATQRLATINTIGARDHRGRSRPILGAISDYSGSQEADARPLHGARRSPRSRAMFFIHGRHRPGVAALHRRPDRRRRQLRLLRGAAAAHRPPDEIDRVSTAGYALGYLGGGLLLALNLAWIQKPDWFGLPSGPSLTRPGDAPGPAVVRLGGRLVDGLLDPALPDGVPEPPSAARARRARRARARCKVAFVRLGETFRELRGYRQAFLMLLAFLIYNDGIQTIIRMATAYGDRDRDRPERADRRHPAGPVRRASPSPSCSGCWPAGSAPSARSFSGCSSTPRSASSATS